MIDRLTLTKDQVYEAMDKQEFGKEVVSSRESVVIIMTQDWCPQWRSMSGWVYNIQSDKNINIYVLIYNKADFSKEFMSFKENVFKNGEIPYLRYYKNGKLFKETNYVSEQKFKEILGI